MSHQTRCPTCQTTYPMPPAKLGDPNARAKCGQCQQVFALNDNLVSPKNTPAVNKQQTPATPSDDLSLPVVPRRTKRTRAVPTEGMIHDGMDHGNNPASAGGVAFSNEELDNFLNDNINLASNMSKNIKDDGREGEGESWIDDLLNDDKPVNIAKQVNQTPTAPIVNDVDLNAIIPTAVPRPKKPASTKKIEAETPTAQQLAEKQSISGQLFWAIGCAVLVALLGVQYALFNTDKLAKNPESAGLVQTLCGVLPCKVPSADLSSLRIDSAVQNGRDVIIIINNTSATEQLFPYLLVQLKDPNGKVVADFVADTKDYLGDSQTTLLAGQYKRIMLSTANAVDAGSVMVTPFYR